MIMAEHLKVYFLGAVYHIMERYSPTHVYGVVPTEYIEYISPKIVYREGLDGSHYFRV